MGVVSLQATFGGGGVATYELLYLSKSPHFRGSHRIDLLGAALLGAAAGLRLLGGRRVAVGVRGLVFDWLFSWFSFCLPLLLVDFFCLFV